MMSGWCGFIDMVLLIVARDPGKRLCVTPPPQLKKIFFIEVQLTYIIFLGSKITADGDCSHEMKGHLLLWKKSFDQPRQHMKKQGHYFANKDQSSLSYGFSSSHVWM